MSPHTTRLRTAAIGATAALALTACGGGTGSDGDEAAGGKPQGVVSRAEAEKIAGHYEQIINKANAAQDEKLLATVEAGQVYAMDEAACTVAKTWPDKQQKAYAEPSSYRDRQYMIPEKGTTTWFAVRATSSEDSRNSVVLVFDKVGGTHTMVLSLWTDGGEPLPEPALDKHGLAEAANPGTKVGKFAPADLGAAYADLLQTGGRKKGAALTSTKPAENAKKTYRRSSKKSAADGMATQMCFAKSPADPSVYALRTADGGILALFPAAHKQESLLKKPYCSNASLVPSKEQSAFGATGGRRGPDPHPPRRRNERAPPPGPPPPLRSPPAPRLPCET
ncbi:hypothetical protein ACWCQ0_12450 [Streptomyces massasporeus]|uniref:hypothetical protein n=1 Tax=Streptomyces massasporeus TaxID=67324 RepID=UPI0033C1643F